LCTPSSSANRESAQAGPHFSAGCSG
jgi:hypothetical protein